jgi:hypothetical protein
MSQASAVAEVVNSQVMRIQIPIGLSAGDSFIVTPTNGRVFTVIVPEGAPGGSFIQVIVPDEAQAVQPKDGVKLTKATIGAAVVGGVIGAVVLGPVCGLLLAGGAAYATTREHGKVGEASRKVGDTTYKGLSSAKNWVEKKVNESSSSSTTKK